MPSTEKSPEFYKHYPALFHTYEVSFEQYSSLADDKSAFGKIAIDSLWVQSNSQNKAVYEKLLLSHRYFSVLMFVYACCNALVSNIQTKYSVLSIISKPIYLLNPFLWHWLYSL